MLLVPTRPLALPVERKLGWYDDLAATGGINDAYSVVGRLAPSAEGVQLQATSGQTGEVMLSPTTFSAAECELEVVGRRTAGAAFYIAFRYLDGSNKLGLNIDSSNFRLFRVVDGAWTYLATLTQGLTGWNRFGVRAQGALIEVYLNGTLLWAVTEPANRALGGFQLQAWDGAAGTARSDVQYLAIRRL